MDLRRTFDREALLYNKARPHYPAELFDRMIEVTGIQPGDNLLEIGPGTGQATAPLLERGFHIVGVELGEHLADVARHELRHYPNVEIRVGGFEDAEFDPHSFRMIFSATAFHWIKPEVKYAKTHELLIPGGHLAIIHTNHISDQKGDRYHERSQAIYNRYWPPGKDPHHLPVPNDIKPPEFDEKLFDLIHFQVFPLTIRYSAEQYTELLDTYSPTLSLPEPERTKFLGEIKRLIDDEFDGYHVKHFAMSLAILQAK